MSKRASAFRAATALAACILVTAADVSNKDLRAEDYPGSRQVMASLKLMGPWGQQQAKDHAALTLEPGGVYFLHPDWDGAAHKTLRLQAERLPASYDAALRAKLMEWQRHHTQGRSLED